MKEIVFLVEEPSMKEFLKAILPKNLPENVTYTIIHHEPLIKFRMTFSRGVCN